MRSGYCLQLSTSYEIRVLCHGVNVSNVPVSAAAGVKRAQLVFALSVLLYSEMQQLVYMCT